MTELLDFIVVGGDLRMKYTCDFLKSAGYKVAIAYADQNDVRLSDICAKNIILPVPLTDNAGNVNMPYSSIRLSPAHVITSIQGVERVFGGMVPESVGALCRENGIKAYDYMKHEPLVIKNAQATAEGAIRLIIEHTPFVICGARILVAGYGRIGKLISAYLKAMGACVSIEARNPVDLEWIKCRGFESISLKDLNSVINRFDVIVNTVPSVIFGENEIRNFKDGAIYIELASKPYGIDKTYAEKHNVTVVNGASLPGKTAPRTAGEAIGCGVLDIIKEGEVLIKK